MNAVDQKSHHWKIVLGAVVVAMSAILVVSMVVDLPNVPISTAFGGSTPGQSLLQHDCSSIAPDGEDWQGVDIDLEREDLRGSSPVSVHVGSAQFTVEPIDHPGSEWRWHSNLGIDAVVVQTPAQSRLYHFDDERFDGAHGPLGEQTVERVTLCYDLELTVNTDANPSYTRTYAWSINESVDPAQWQLEPGTSGVSTYKVSVTKDGGTARGWRVNGTITIDNLTPSDVELESVSAVIDGDFAAGVDCGGEVAGFVLASGASLTCGYQSDLPNASRRTATATIRTRGRVSGGSAAAEIDFERADVDEVGQSVYVTNSQGRAWTFRDSGTSVYQRTFHCEADAGLHPSAVRISGTAQRSSTSVSVDCQPDETQTTAARPDER